MRQASRTIRGRTVYACGADPERDLAAMAAGAVRLGDRMVVRATGQIGTVRAVRYAEETPEQIQARMQRTGDYRPMGAGRRPSSVTLLLGDGGEISLRPEAIDYAAFYDAN